MQHAFRDIRYVGTAYRHLCSRSRKLLEPERYVLYHIIVRAVFLLGLRHDAMFHFRCLPDAVQVMLTSRTVYGDTYGQMLIVLLYEILYLLRVVVDAVGGEGEAVGVEPVVVQSVHLRLQIIAYLVYKIYFEERLAADEVPDDTFLVELVLMFQNVVDGLFCHLP